MNSEILQQAIEEVLRAQSVPEVGLVLQKYPVLLEKGAADTVFSWKVSAEQDSRTELADALQEAINRIGAFLQSTRDQTESQRLPQVEPKVGWAIKARTFLYTKERAILAEAIKEAEKQNEIEIVKFLQLFTNYADEQIDTLTNTIIPALQQSGRHEEGMTIYLLRLEVQAAWMVLREMFPLEDQPRAREDGREACKEAIRISAALKDRACQAYYSNLLANDFNKSRSFDEAIPYRAAAVKLYRELAEEEPHIYKKEAADSLHELGLLHSKQNNSADAEHYYFEALELYWELAKEGLDQYRDDLSAVMNNLGKEYQHRHDWAAAERYYNEAILLLWRMGHEEIPIRDDLAMSLNNFAALLQEQGQSAIAEDFHKYALEIREELVKREPDKHKGDLAQTLYNLGAVQFDLKKVAEGEQSITKALNLCRELAERKPEVYKRQLANILNILGVVQSDRGNLDACERSFVEALTIRKELAHQNSARISDQDVANTLQNLGQFYILKNLPERAKDYFEEARDLIEGFLDEVVTLDERNLIMRKNITVFDNLLLCYMQLYDWKKVLEIAESSKSRSLNDFLNSKSEELMPKAPSEEVYTKVRKLGFQYYETIRQLKEVAALEKVSAEQIMQWWEVVQDEDRDKAMDFHVNKRDKLAKERFQLKDKLRDLEKQIQGYDENFPPKANKISVETIFELSKKTARAIVLFRFTVESTVIIFVFPNGEIIVEKLPDFDRQKLFRLFYDNWLRPYESWKRGRIRIDDWMAAIEKVLDDIDRELMFKVRNVLDRRTDIKSVLFVPNHSLALLPLHAARWRDEAGDKHYLLEKYTISYASSIAVFKRCYENQRRRSNKMLIMTNPTDDDDLRHSEEEVGGIKTIEAYKDHLELPKGKAVKVEVVKALNGEFGLVHFACHGFYDHYNAFNSGLVMTDGVLSLSEIINSDLKTNWLTTLAACETGMVDFRSPTDEHFGLPLGFIFAGSPSVWASLWAVSDHTTAEIMIDAYQNLNREEYKDNKPEALRQAQLGIMSKFPHPFFWAGFQHFGI
jgi:tetratricopeptide (TPR) repeat protein